MKVLKGYCIFDKQPKHKASDIIHEFIACRMKNGLWVKNIKKDFSDKNFKYLFLGLFRFIIGNKASSFLFPKSVVDIPEEYTGSDYLYHITPIKLLDKIKSEGLTVQRKWIYLTDNYDFIINDKFLNWKASRLKEDTDFCILKIDTQRLRKKQKLYLTNLKHEIVTDSIDPEFIFFE